jgi:hypothetical protein
MMMEKLEVKVGDRILARQYSSVLDVEDMDIESILLSGEVIMVDEEFVIINDSFSKTQNKITHDSIFEIQRMKNGIMWDLVYTR